MGRELSMNEEFVNALANQIKVIKIPIRILKSYDFMIQHYENDSNLNWILNVVES